MGNSWEITFLREFGKTLEGVEKSIFDSFARALESIPIALAMNSGYHPQQAIEMLREKLKNFPETENWMKNAWGLNVKSLGLINSIEEGILDTYRAKVQMLSAAVDTVGIVLRIDKVLSATDRTANLKRGK